MALVDARGYNLTPDLTRQLLGGVRVGQGMQQFAITQQAMQEAEEMREREKQVRALAGEIGIQKPLTQQEQMLAQQTAELTGISPQAEAEQPRAVMSQEEITAQMRRIDPVMAEKTLQAMGFDDASKRAEASRFAARMLTLPREQQDQEILQRAEKLRAEGRDPSDTLELLDMNQAQRDQAYQGFQLMDLATKERLDFQQRAGTTDKSLQVKSSDILPDGTTIQIMGDGSTRVTDPTGVEVTGQARADVIRQAEEFGIDVQQRRAQGRGVGAMTAKKADVLYAQVDKMRTNTDNLRDLIAEVKAGANSGPLINRLPTLTAATQRLENIKNRLGLDVVGSVTFGALSAKELELAQQTAVPDLRPDELVRWAEEKVVANEKLANYLTEQASFLEQPGNTRAMWAEKVRQRKVERDAQAAEQGAGAGFEAGVEAGATAVAQTPAVGQPQRIGRFNVTVEQ